VVFAEKPNRPFASRWSEVRSNSIGLACVVGLASSVTVAGLPRTASAISCASGRLQTRSAFSSASSSFFFHFGSNHLPG
jgi:hypothetical protein